MKKLLIATAAIVSLAAAGSASAQVAQTLVPVGGTVDKACGVGPQSGGGPNNPTASIALGEMTDGDGFLSVPQQEVNFGNVWCNAPASVTLSASKLVHDGSHTTTDLSSFDTQLDLVLSPSASGGIFVYLGGDTSPIRSTSRTNPNHQAFETGGNTYAKALLDVALETGSTDRPLAGAWSGSVSFTATAN